MPEGMQNLIELVIQDGNVGEVQEADIGGKESGKEGKGLLFFGVGRIFW